MGAVSCDRAPVDRTTLVAAIREVFARSAIFGDATLSDPCTGPGGEVTVDVRFDSGPPTLRVTAASDTTAYAILHELASVIVDVERERTRELSWRR